MRWPARLLAPLLLMLVGGCGSDSSRPADTAGPGDGDSSAETSPSDTATPPGSIDWQTCGDGIDCALLTVPLDYGDPSLGDVQLALVRSRATAPSKREGVLIYVPGSGGRGTPTVFNRLGITPGFGELLRRFDVVGLDVRGHGMSRPRHAACLSDGEADELRAIHPKSHPVNVVEAAIAALHAGCAEQLDPEFTRRVDLRSRTLDIERLREALGEDEISLFTESYGTLSVALYASMFPDRVRAYVLGGSMPPTYDPKVRLAQRARAVEDAVEAFFAWCASEPCAFRPSDATTVPQAFDALVTAVADTPVAAGARELSVADLVVGSITYLIGGDYAAFDRALAAAAAGDGSELLAAADGLVGRTNDGTYPETFARSAISAVDAPHQAGTTVASWLAFVASDIEPASPHLGHLFVSGFGELTEATWPFRAVVVAPPIHAPDAPAGLIVSNDDDPLTGREGALEMQQALGNGTKLLESRRRGHIVRYPCAMQRITAFILNPAAEPDLSPCSDRPADNDTVLGEVTDVYLRNPAALLQQEEAIGDLVADAMRAAVGSDAIAFVNGGGIRTDLPSAYLPADTNLRRPAGGYASGPPYDVVWTDIEKMIPFGNRLTLLETDGAGIWAFLEAGVAEWAAGTPTDRLMQVSGLRYTFSASAAAGARVQSATDAGGAPITNDGARTYTLVMPDWVYYGGQRYLGFLAIDATLGEPIADAVRAWIQEGGSLTPTTHERIVQLP